MTYYKKDFNKTKFVVCKYCGYNNEFYRFKNYGTCLRCGKIIDGKVYLKCKLDLANKKINIREDHEVYYYGK